MSDGLSVQERIEAFEPTDVEEIVPERDCEALDGTEPDGVEPCDCGADYRVTLESDHEDEPLVLRACASHMHAWTRDDGGVRPEWYEPGDATLEPHPYELGKAVTGEHVVVFTWNDYEWQFEISGVTAADDLDLEWQTVEIPGEEAARVLNAGSCYSVDGEDADGRGYTLLIRGGRHHPKGSPVHTPRGDEA